MDGVSDRVPTPTPLEAAVHDFLYLNREHPTVTLGRDRAEYTIVPTWVINGLKRSLDPEASRPRAHVSIDPGIKGGVPCIAGTRLTADWMAERVWGGMTLEEIQRDWDYLTRADVLVACWYVSQYGSRTWRRRWNAWSTAAMPSLWSVDKQHECPWPPSEARQPRAVAGEQEAPS